MGCHQPELWQQTSLRYSFISSIIAVCLCTACSWKQHRVRRSHFVHFVAVLVAPRQHQGGTRHRCC
jgi:hypothetical protein